MLAKGAYGTSLGENTYGMPGQPKPPARKQTAGQQQNQQNMEAMGWGQSQATDMSAYAPGRARPIQPQSQGTPFQAYSPDQNAQQNDSRWGAGNWAYSQAQQPAVPAYTQGATGIDGQQFASPQQAFAQRDALIQRINEARAPMFAGAGTYLGDGAPPPSWGQKPPLDFNTMMGQANDMVAGGWQNPFAQQPAGLSIMHPSSNPYRQPQFQEPTIPQVPGVQDYYPQDPGVPDERSFRPPQPAYSQPSAIPQQQSPQRYYTRQQGSTRNSPRTSQQMIADTQSVVRDTRNPMQRHAANMGAGRQQPARQPASQDQRWLNSLTPDNRRAYRMMQVLT